MFKLPFRTVQKGRAIHILAPWILVVIAGKTRLVVNFATEQYGDPRGEYSVKFHIDLEQGTCEVTEAFGS